MKLTRRRFILTSLLLASGCRTLEEQKRKGKKALLASPYENRAEDLFLMNFLLRERGFETTTLSREECNETNIFRNLEQIAKTSNDPSQTLFYYAGHYPIYFSQTGEPLMTQEGVLVKGEDDAGRLSPQELFYNLRNPKGKKAIIIDACHSGIYPDYARDKKPIKNYVVIAACPAGTETLFGKVFIQGRWTGALTYGIYQTLTNNKKVNLSEAKINCGTEEYRKMTQQQLKSKVPSSKFPISFEMQRESDTDYWI